MILFEENAVLHGNFLSCFKNATFPLELTNFKSLELGLLHPTPPSSSSSSSSLMVMVEDGVGGWWDGGGLKVDVEETEIGDGLLLFLVMLLFVLLLLEFMLLLVLLQMFLDLLIPLLKLL